MSTVSQSLQSVDELEKCRPCIDNRDRRRVRRVLNPPAREAKARTRTFLREKMIFDHGLFTSYEDKEKRRTGKTSVRGFSEIPGGWTSGFWLARVFTQLRTYTTIGLGLSMFFFSELCLRKKWRDYGGSGECGQMRRRQARAFRSGAWP